MSTWTGMNNGNPESLSDTRCAWPLCTLRVPNRFAKEGLHLCREHALFTWAVIDQQIRDGQPIEHPDDETYQPAPDKSPGIIYYIRTGGRIKIGHTTNIERRLAQYPPDVEILHLMQGTKEHERQEHQRFRAYLADGREWFQDRPEVTNHIVELAAADPSWRHMTDGDWRRRKSPSVTIRHADPAIAGSSAENVAR